MRQPGDDIPTCMDDLVREARACVRNMRRQMGDREDFDFLIRQALEGFLADYHPSVRAFTMRAIFGP